MCSRAVGKRLGFGVRLGESASWRRQWEGRRSSDHSLDLELSRNPKQERVERVVCHVRVEIDQQSGQKKSEWDLELNHNPDQERAELIACRKKAEIDSHSGQEKPEWEQSCASG